ncbi:MAG: amidohydrolase [Oscillospiraceae bacterium]|nr:amidohydrolase [Oscillospiraceae bacterium]
MPASPEFVFDIHTHFSIEETAISEDADKLGYVVENHSIEEHLASMDRLGISFALLSCPTLKYLDDRERCIAYCHQANLAGAAIVAAHPDRFRFAALLPLPYADAACEELLFCVNELHASAVGLCSNYNGHYLGEAAFECVFQLMNEKHLVGLLHPAAPLDYPKNPITGKILPMFEFITDTTRTLLDLFAFGTLKRSPNVRLVVPHSGSCLPVALDRYYGIMRSQGSTEPAPIDQLYFDLACDAYPRGAKILLTLTDHSHILYGTDYPAIPEFVLRNHLNTTRTFEDFCGHNEEILGQNALQLLGITI